jgi:hypothetical protein
MQQPAIQAALDNLVEVIRTALTAEFLEYFRDGDTKPVRGRSKAKAKAMGGKATKRPAPAKKIKRRAAK